MARSMTPTGYNGYDDDMYQSAAYTHDISEQMRVPKRIRATGEYFDDHDMGGIGNGNVPNSWNYHQRIDMSVPDRIVVTGHDQHHGTKSAPREIILENSILPKDPGTIRVSTPPRVITLSEHHFPSASDEPVENEKDYERNNEYQPRSLDSMDDNIKMSKEQRNATYKNRNELIVGKHYREETPTFGGSVENLSPTEEITHLRRQVSKMNRRLLALELDSIQRQQREKIIYAVGLAYFILKAFMWLGKK